MKLSNRVVVHSLIGTAIYLIGIIASICAVTWTLFIFEPEATTEGFFTRLGMLFTEIVFIVFAFVGLVREIKSIRKNSNN